MYEEFGRRDSTGAWNEFTDHSGWIFSLLDRKSAERLSEASARSAAAHSAALRCAVSGTARPVEGGYRLSGRWRLPRPADDSGWLLVLAALDEAVPDETTSGPADPGPADPGERGGTDELSATDQPDRTTDTMPATARTERVRGFLLHHQQTRRSHRSGPTGSTPSGDATGSAVGDNDVVFVDQAFVPGGLVGGLNHRDIHTGSDAAPAAGTRALRPVPAAALILPGCSAAALGVAKAAVDTVAAPNGQVKAGAAELRPVLADADHALRETRDALHAVAAELDASVGQRLPLTGRQNESVRRWVGQAARVSSQVLMTMYELAEARTTLTGRNPVELLVRDSMPVLQFAHQAAALLEVEGQVQYGMGIA
jgi:hypothetical protein